MAVMPPNAASEPRTLRLTDMPVAQISDIVGFEDTFYFCRLFTRQYGISPQKYRKEFRNAGSSAKQGE